MTTARKQPIILQVVRDDLVENDTKVRIRKELLRRFGKNKILLAVSSFLAIILVVAAILSFSKKESPSELKTVTIKDLLPHAKGKSAFTIEEVRDYLCKDNFIKLAVNSANKIGCSPSVLMAQNILESRLGKSKLTIKTNNKGNVKCPHSHQHWKCKANPTCIKAYDKIERSNDYYQSVTYNWQSWKLKLSCLIKYSSIKNCKSSMLDYKGWAKAFHESPYATDKDYDKKIISIIETYGLNRIDSCISNTLITTYSGKYVIFEPFKD